MKVRRIDPVTGEVDERRCRHQRVRWRQPSTDPVHVGEWTWFPLAVVSQKETLAQIRLEDLGFAVFVPRVGRWRNRNRYDRARQEKRLIFYPWLPGLVFVGMRQPHRWDLIADWPVLHALSSVDGRLRPMDRDQLWLLMLRFGSDQFIAPDEQRFMETGQEFAEGDVVQFAEGPLADVPLEVQEISGRTATVFAEFFGATRGFEADVANLRPWG